ncbi:MAG: septum formation initiator family protein [Clostridia bacterium]|nr:septum formation initiator family protein [Clostridia bacterium]
MAVKDFNEAKKQHKKVKKFKPHKVQIAMFIFAVFAIGIAVVGVIIPNYVAAAQYSEEASKIESQITALSEESAEITKSLDNKDELYEKIAREEYGYCKPGEKVYYNSSFGE